MAITVRKADMSDLEDLLAIEASAIPGYAYLDEAKDFLIGNTGNQGEMILALADGIPAGMGRYSVLPDGSGWLEILRVKKEYQRQGIGMAIYQRYMELAEETGAPSVAMFTGRRNIASKSLAERWGFAVAEDFSGYSVPLDRRAEHSEYHLITDPDEVEARIGVWHEDWGKYMCFNRTFMKYGRPLYEWLAGRNMVYGSGETTIVLGWRMLKERGLHIGFMDGDLTDALAFAADETVQRGLPSLQIMFDRSYTDMHAFAAHHKMTHTGDLIVMEYVKSCEVNCGIGQ